MTDLKIKEVRMCAECGVPLSGDVVIVGEKILHTVCAGEKIIAAKDVIKSFIHLGI